MQSKPTDASLLKKCEEFHRIDAECQAAADALRAAPAEKSQQLWQSYEETLWPHHGKLAEEIIATPALTCHGAKEKAAVLRLMLLNIMACPGARAMLCHCEPHEQLAWSLVNDLAAIPS
jgi:hypothetical protein